MNLSTLALACAWRGSGNKSTQSWIEKSFKSQGKQMFLNVTTSVFPGTCYVLITKWLLALACAWREAEENPRQKMVFALAAKGTSFEFTLISKSKYFHIIICGNWQSYSADNYLAWDPNNVLINHDTNYASIVSSSLSFYQLVNSLQKMHLWHKSNFDT